MDRTGCLTDDEEIALFAGGAADASNRLRAERHMARCGVCRARWAEADGPSAFSSAEPALDVEAMARSASDAWRDRPGTGRRWGWGAAAAAAVFLLAVLAARLIQGPESARSRLLPGGRAISGRDERVETGSSSDVVRLPDGSRIRIGPRSRVAFLAAGSGERLVARLERGILEAEIAKAAGAVRILAEAGEIRVVGTVFTARSFRIHPSDGPGRPMAILSVEVTEGAVDLEGGSGCLRIAAGRRGIARANPGEAPVIQEAAPLDREEAARRWGSGWGAPGFFHSWNAATLLAGTWTGEEDWEAVLADRRRPPDLRRVAAALAGACAEGAEAGRLRDLFGEEPDEEVRRALLPHVARLLGRDAGGWLDQVARRDLSGRVRQAARGLSGAAEEE